MAAPPRQFAVQRAAGRSWQTLAVRPRQETGQAALAEAVRANPRWVLRLIQVDYKAGSDCGEFDWRLVELYDPRQHGMAPDLGMPPPSAPPSRPAPAPGRRRGPERVRAPLRLYGAVLGLGAGLAALGWAALRAFGW